LEDKDIKIAMLVAEVKELRKLLKERTDELIKERCNKSIKELKENSNEK
jgi:hypothetical protein